MTWPEQQNGSDSDKALRTHSCSFRTKSVLEGELQVSGLSSEMAFSSQEV